MLFINTRPTERAQALTQCLAQAHFDVIDLPILGLRAKAFDMTLAQNYQALFAAQVIVVVSPTAVDVGMQYLQQAGLVLENLQHLQWIAVGKKTASVLAEYGIASLVPEVETSEGMLSLPIFKTLEDIHTVAFWRGEGGRQFMMQECAENNIEILNFVLYERFCPIETIEKFPQIAQRLLSADVLQYAPYWVGISSEASWKNWIVLCQNYPKLLNECHYLVLGERLYRLLNNDKNVLKLNYAVSALVDLDPETVCNTIHELQRTL